jgi:hypothetical protein
MLKEWEVGTAQQGGTKFGSLGVGLAAKHKSRSQFMAGPLARPAKSQDLGSQYHAMFLAQPANPKD